jgi:hypothetical protein
MNRGYRWLIAAGLFLALFAPLAGEPAATSGTVAPPAAPDASTNAGTTNTAFSQLGTDVLLDTVRNAVRAGEYGKAHDAWDELRRRKQDLPAELVLSLLVHSGKTTEARDWLKNNPELLVRPGEHRYAVALLYYADGDFGLFFRHLVASFEEAGQARQRALREVVLAIHNQEYSRALRLLDQPLLPREDALHRNLRAYVYLLQGDTENGYAEVKKSWADNTTLALPKLQLLFQLALKNKSGKESAYWGEQILKNHPGQQKDPVFLNNL